MCFLTLRDSGPHHLVDIRAKRNLGRQPTPAGDSGWPLRGSQTPQLETVLGGGWQLSIPKCSGQKWLAIWIPGTWGWERSQHFQWYLVGRLLNACRNLSTSSVGTMLVYHSIERDICKKHKNEKQTQEQGLKRENRTAVALEGKFMRMWATRGGILSGALAYKTLCFPKGSPPGGLGGREEGSEEAGGSHVNTDTVRQSELIALNTERTSHLISPFWFHL